MMDKIRLVIIDENTTVRQALETRLSLIPQLDVVGCAESVNEAERAVQQLHPDVVLIEPKRLNGTGLLMLDRIMSVEHAPEVIVLTSYRDENEELVASELGVNHYLLKNIDTNTLVSTIFSVQRGDASGSALHT